MLAAAQPVVEAVVSTFFADHLQAAELRHVATALNRLADANPATGDVDCGLWTVESSGPKALMLLRRAGWQQQ